MEYDKEFEEWWSTFTVNNGLKKRTAYKIWQAARKDHYLIGEEVESYGSDGWKLSVVTATREGIGFTKEPELVRCIPALEPKKDSLTAIYDTFEKLAYALQKTSETLNKAINDGIIHAKDEI